MRVLVACEYSGTVRDAFAKLGHDAWSLDILPTEKPGNHIQGDLMKELENFHKWDLIVAHPPCTYLTVTGNKWMKPEFKDRFPDRASQRTWAINFFLLIANARCERIAIENPVGIMSTRWRKPDQYIQPYQFGEPHRKKTGLWLKGLPLLKPTKIVEPALYTYKDGRTDPMWHVESMRMKPHDRMKYRSKTFQGIAGAMADQWTLTTPSRKENDHELI